MATGATSPVVQGDRGTVLDDATGDRNAASRSWGAESLQRYAERPYQHTHHMASSADADQEPPRSGSRDPSQQASNTTAGQAGKGSQQSSRQSSQDVAHSLFRPRVAQGSDQFAAGMTNSQSPAAKPYATDQSLQVLAITHCCTGKYQKQSCPIMSSRCDR